MVLATPVLSDAATIVTSTSPASLPGTNLQKRAIKEVWRSLDAENAYVEVTLPEYTGINLIALLSHSGSSGSIARVRGAMTSSELISAPVYDSGSVPARSHQEGYDGAWAASVDDTEYGALNTNHLILWLQEGYDLPCWRIDITDPGAEYFDAGRLYISKAWQPATNMNYGLQEGIIDPSKVAITASGRISPKKNPKRRVADLSLSFATEQEMRDSAFDIEWERGASEDVLMIPDPEAGPYLQKRTIYGRLVGLSPIVSAAHQIFEKQFRIEEITG